ncbi:S8 family serine peptidase [Corynebacterium pseudodiphtheriticum]|uniref:S8 family serine peptidase n=1 Tax=Corynebacterium pseudodiphtheriticum TaxID=37637 RepID=UPI002542CEAC|nr:S8 family serine peptidase [Corynebacterium pseudodiphtheriticum]MDK4242364.1 S8 family serine peptidase [Corynebacterium pseudodiphtheriticum]MDK4277311.1 S8 family serine peptidase [Corynebacterium pseudodiphtheriticum]MDK4296026.1 S8 family serine peptidase [Corynebacterium pseudodiphtheriticum]
MQKVQQLLVASTAGALGLHGFMFFPVGGSTGSATAQAQTRDDVEVRRTVDCVDPIVAPAPTPAAPGAEAEFSRPWQDAFGSSPGSAPDHYGRTEQTGSEPTHHQQPLTVGTDYRTAHQFATGAGVRVAVIDTGVFNHEQLHVEPVADLVSPAENNPLLDCDGHGTIVAGIIGAEQSGVAPNAQILSIRQSSAHYSSRQPNNTPDHQHAPDAEEPELTGTLSSFAQAIHTALDHDAQVINASVVSCIPPEHAEHLHTQALDDALARAEHQQVPVVAAAGNAGQGCERGSIVFPGNNETVVTVGALATPHEHAEYSMPQLGHPTGAGDGDGGDARDDGDAAYNSGGPNDVALSTPGRVSVGLSPNSQAWASGIIRNGQPSGLHGTSFAAPVVTGTVALLRERYPHASAAEIRELLVTASYPQHGFIDPVRVLTHPAPGVEPAGNDDDGGAGGDSAQNAGAPSEHDQAAVAQPRMVVAGPPGNETLVTARSLVALAVVVLIGALVVTLLAFGISARMRRNEQT